MGASAAAVKAVPRRQWEGPSYVGSTVELDSAARLDAITWHKEAQNCARTMVEGIVAFTTIAES